MNDVNSLSHSKWRCKYHIVFAPKYRRMVIYKQLKVDIGKILRQLCDHHGSTFEILNKEFSIVYISKNFNEKQESSVLFNPENYVCKYREISQKQFYSMYIFIWNYVLCKFYFSTTTILDRKSVV